MSGIMISFEGPDGAGKTSVLKDLVPRLKQIASTTMIETREPGGNPISEAIRKIILDPKNTMMDPRTEALLYAAARRQHIVETILPALKKGEIVLCDRFVDSSIAYQGAGREIGEKAVFDMNQFAINGLMPDLTLYLDVPSEIGIDRIKQNRTDQYDRLDQEKLSFHQKVRNAYLKLAHDHPERIVTVDATQPLSQVVIECEAAILGRFPDYFHKGE